MAPPGTSTIVVPPSFSLEKSTSFTTKKEIHPRPMTTQYIAKVNTLYQRAAEALILRQYDTVHMSCLSAFSELSPLSFTDNSSPATLITLRKKVWALYVTFIASILAEESRINSIHPETKRLLEKSASQVVEEVWVRVRDEGYCDEEGYVDGEVVIACLLVINYLFIDAVFLLLSYSIVNIASVLLCLGQQLPKIAKDIIESWLFSIPEMVLLQFDYASANGIKGDPLLKTYEQIVELYVLHILPRLKDWGYARSFLEDNNRVDEDRKKAEHISSSTKLPNGMNQSTINGRISHTPSPSLLADNRKNGSSNNNAQLIRSSLSSTSSTEVVDTQRRPTSVRGIRIPSANSFSQVASAIIYCGEKMAQSFTIPRIIFLCIFVYLYNGSNAKARRKISEFFNEILAKIWETIKAGTVITYV
ncbi:7443_t:CDS:2 [Ambispora gerdemannii]|uniref:7443_t:CDS:1 n=1 Tax=Ambispora gerdemannii TaxID=144530 RepID=A0A9N8YQ30_9GLOM|nr:7443_t:CDS:2 [Ambispora gerdemannii]